MPSSTKGSGPRAEAIAGASQLSDWLRQSKKRLGCHTMCPTPAGSYTPRRTASAEKGAPAAAAASQSRCREQSQQQAAVQSWTPEHLAASPRPRRQPATCVLFS